MNLLDRFNRWLTERPGMGHGLPSTDIQSVRHGINIDTLVLLTDVSYYQGEIDFAKMKLAGIAGTIIRAGQNRWIDVKFKINWLLAKAAGLPRGSYWFYDSRVPPKEQAQLWYSLVKDDPAELCYVADLEENYGGAYGGISHFMAFIMEFQRLMKVPNDRIVIYSGFYWWAERVGNDPWFANYALWLAWYANMSVVRVPAPWREDDLVFWQFTSSGDGKRYGVSSSEIDLDWWVSDLEMFRLRWGLGPLPPDEPPSDNKPSYIITYNAANEPMDRYNLQES